MKTPFHTRRDFVDTLFMPMPESRLQLAADPIEQIAWAERADWTLLRLVVCAAVATLALALASSVIA